MISNQSKNLFSRAIAFSGNVFNSWALPTPDLNFAVRFGHAMGFTGSTEAQLLQFLENAKAEDLLVETKSILTAEEKYGKLLDIMVGPVVEPLWSKTPFLTRDPVVAARTAWSNNIDAIFSSNSFEGLYQAYKEWADNIDLYIDTFNNNPAFFAPLVPLKLDSSSSQGKAFGQRIKDLYFNSTSPLSRDTLLQFYRVNF
jgi:carboxylesterase type B